MEEKLYFKPEDYGKKKEKRTKGEKAEGKNHKALKLTVFLLFLVIIIFIILWLLHGKTTVSGQYPENIKNESLECTSDKIVYEKINSVDSNNKELKIVAVFVNENKLSSISLRYALTYPTESEAYSAESVSHVQFGRSLSADGLSFEEFNNKFSIVGDKLIVTLYATGGDFKEYANSYFLIGQNDFPQSLVDFRKIYEEQGFICASTNDKK